MGYGKINNKQAGFTIVELLIVVVVIAILAAITIVAFNGITQRAKDSAAASAASQVSKKLSIFAIDTAETYPTSLAALATVLGAPAPGGGETSVTVGQTSYEYRVSGDYKTYCMTVTTQATSYYITQAGQSATKGSCAGHSLNGAVAVTNYYYDPKPATTTYVSSWDGGNVGTTTTNVASAWSRSGRANRIVFPSTITSVNGGATPSLVTSYTPYVGQKYTISLSFRVVSGAAGIGSATIDRNSAIGTLTTHATGGTGIASMTVGQTYKVFVTFTADSTATVANGLRLYVNLSNKSASATVDVADVDFYPGDYQANRNAGSGDSPNWIWNGSANNSTSTGPSL